MLLLIVIALLAIRFTIYLWDNRRRILFFKSLQNDMSSNFLIGHALHFLGDNEKRMTSFCLSGREAIKHGGISKLRVAHRSFVVLADADMVDLVLKSCLEKADFMSVTKNLIGNGSIFAPVPIWRPRRKILAPAFAQRYLNKYVPLFDKCSRKMIENLQPNVGKEAFSIWKYMTAYTMDSVCATALDIDLNIQNNHGHPFLKAFEDYCNMVSKRICFPWLYNDTVYELIPWYAVIKKHISFMWQFVDDIIQTKRKSEKDDGDESSVAKSKINLLHQRSLVDLLMKPSGETRYTDLELREELLVVTIAGTDTSATGAAFVLAMLARSSTIRAKVHQEIQEVFGDSDRVVTAEDVQKLKYLDAVMKETLRLYPPVPVIVRHTDKDLTLPNGSVLPKGCDVIMNLWALQRNPRYWGADAEEFKPERFLDGRQHHHAAYAAFSCGPRSCLGYQYAVLSMKTVVSNLLRRFTVRHPLGLEPVEEANEPMRVKFDVMMKDADNWVMKLDNKD